MSRFSTVALALLCLLVGSCGLGRSNVEGWPDVDLGVPVEIYKSTDQRDLHIHMFAPVDAEHSDRRGAVLFFHGGGYRSTRVPQFEHQAKAVADAGMVGLIVEYRVTAEGTTRDDAIADGADAARVVAANPDVFGVDPQRIAMAGSSAGGHLVTQADSSAAAQVLFNPAVSPATSVADASVETIVFHSREDRIVEFDNAEGFCAALAACELVAFDEGDHGFFNDEPALTVTTNAMIDFLKARGW